MRKYGRFALVLVVSGALACQALLSDSDRATGVVGAEAGAPSAESGAAESGAPEPGATDSGTSGRADGTVHFCEGQSDFALCADFDEGPPVSKYGFATIGDMSLRPNGANGSAMLEVVFTPNFGPTATYAITDPFADSVSLDVEVDCTVASGSQAIAAIDLESATSAELVCFVGSGPPQIQGRVRTSGGSNPVPQPLATSPARVRVEVRRLDGGSQEVLFSIDGVVLAKQFLEASPPTTVVLGARTGSTSPEGSVRFDNVLIRSQ